MATAAGIGAREKVFIGGEWVEPAGADPLPVVNSTTEETIATIPGCTPVEVDHAVEAARDAFEGWSRRRGRSGPKRWRRSPRGSASAPRS